LEFRVAGFGVWNLGLRLNGSNEVDTGMGKGAASTRACQMSTGREIVRRTRTDRSTDQLISNRH
jgi:hypothetical protein